MWNLVTLENLYRIKHILGIRIEARTWNWCYLNFFNNGDLWLGSSYLGVSKHPYYQGVIGKQES